MWDHARQVALATRETLKKRSSQSVHFRLTLCPTNILKSSFEKVLCLWSCYRRTVVLCLCVNILRELVIATCPLQQVHSQRGELGTESAETVTAPSIVPIAVCTAVFGG